VRRGVQVESTLPLSVLGLSGARLDVKARWQDSKVTDPVTGRVRVLSAEGGGDPFGYYNENEYAWTVDYRQDFALQHWAWGWSLKERAERPLFKVNELDVYDDGLEANVFLETTRWLGLKIRVEGDNLLDLRMTRERILFTGERGLSAVQRREERVRTRGRRLFLSVSGTF